MGDKTGIGWTDATWNPIAGCTAISPGCDRCYAAQLVATRLRNVPLYRDLAVRPEHGPAYFTGDVRTVPERLDQPLRWTRPRFIFVNSMSDLFHLAVPDHFIDLVFAVMAATPRHTYQVLTKRAQRMRAYLNDPDRQARVRYAMEELAQSSRLVPVGQPVGEWPLRNVIVGVSIENDDYAFRARMLRGTEAHWRMVSAEPLLGDVPSLLLHDVDWLIIGGESGTGARPMELGWVTALVDKAREAGGAGTAVFVKQMGNVLAAELGLPGKGDDITHPRFPRDLAVQEYPPVRTAGEAT